MVRAGELRLTGGELLAERRLSGLPCRRHRHPPHRHDGEDAALGAAGGDEQGLRPHLVQPGQRPAGHPVPPCAAKRPAAGGELSGHDGGGYRGRLCGHRAGLCHSGAGAAAADLHLQPGLSGGAGHRGTGLKIFIQKVLQKLLQKIFVMLQR